MVLINNSKTIRRYFRTSHSFFNSFFYLKYMTINYKDYVYCCYETGNVTCKKTGKVFAAKNTAGYITVTINDRNYLAHRVIWEYYHGPIRPGYVIDHIDGIRSHNSLRNLREVTVGENNHNQGVAKHRQGKVGVTKVSGGYKAKVAASNLGVYSSQYDAACVATHYRDLTQLCYEGRDLPSDHIFHTNHTAFISYINNIKTIDGEYATDIIDRS